MSTTGKRIGRPMKAPSPGKRTTLSLMVSPDLKQRVEEAARASGRTQSTEAEQLILQGLAVRDVLGVVGMSVPEIARRQAETNFRARGYTVMHDRHGDNWLPPGHPAATPSSGFITAEEETS